MISSTRQTIIALPAIAGLLMVAMLGQPARPGLAQASPSAEQATVVAVEGSDRLVVQDEAGATYRIQYVGLRGPVPSSKFHAPASASHAEVVQPGQQVRLEADGRDTIGEFKLRHAFLGDDPLPVGARLLASGWAVAVPYHLDQRFRGEFLFAQEEAMATQVGLRQPGLLGPTAPWRPPDWADGGYVAADPELHRFLDLLATTPTGRSVLARLTRAAPTLILRDLPEGLGGSAEPRGFHLEFNRKMLDADPRVMASVIAHEGTHAIDYVASALDLASYSCFEMEQRAFGIEAQVWLEFFGPNGKPDPANVWEHGQNDVLRFAQRNDLQNFVQRSASYERQCAGEREIT